MNIISSILDYKPLTILIVIAAFLFGIRIGFFKSFGEKLHFVRMAWKVYAVILTVVLLVFTGLLFFDQALLSFIHDQNNVYGNGLNTLGSHLSMNTRFWLMLSFLFLLSYAVGRKNISKLTFGAMVSAALAGVGSQVFKFLTARARPYAQEGPLSFFNYTDIRQHAYQSLPSGDVVIISGASAYFFYSVKNRLLKGVILFLPLCAAYYRINENKHWPSDTFFSTGMGFLAAAMIWTMVNGIPNSILVNPPRGNNA